MKWSALTRMSRKAELYGRETYFREAMADALDLFGDNYGSVLRDSALLMMKPDGLIAGKLETVHSFLADNGFTVAAVEHLTFTRHVWREMWRYQLTAATLDRLAINDLVYPAGPAMVLALRGRADDPLPATVRLSTLKGSAVLAAQQPGTLRHLLRQPNRVFSLVHFADEPADLVRELGVLFEAPQRRRILAALKDGELSEEDATTLKAALDREATQGDPRGAEGLSVAPPAARIAAALSRVAADRPAVAAEAERLRTALAGVVAGETLDWRDFVRDLDATGCRYDLWDLTVVGSHAVTCDDPEHPKQLVNPDPESWLTDAASG